MAQRDWRPSGRVPITYACLGGALSALLAWTVAAVDLPSPGSLPGGQRPPIGPMVPPSPGSYGPVPGTLTPPPRGSNASLAGDTEPLFVFRGARFLGGEGLSRYGLRAVYAPYIGKPMGLSNLEQLRYELTRHFVDQGYLSSGVLVEPDQVVRDGIVTFRIVAGRLTEIRVRGEGRLQADYIRERLYPAREAPFDHEVLKERFQLLLQDPLIERMDGALQPGPEPGSTVLDLEVTRARPWELWLRTDNYRPPSTGAERLYLGGVLRNLTGLGDALELYIGRGFEGQGREGAIAWEMPVDARDTRVFTRYERTDASLLEPTVRDLDIDSDTQRVELGVSHPLLRDLDRSLLVGVLFSWSENTTTLLGEPFSFSEGAVRGESRVSALRLFQELAWRDSRQALGVRSVFSVGVDAFDATIHGDQRPDSDFFVWLGQGQYVRRLGDRGSQLILRGGVQLASEVLLPLERFSVGGVSTVRGYRENEAVGDSGVVASVEVRHPLLRWPLLGEPSVLVLSLFSDWGTAWTHGRRHERQELLSAGLGLLWSLGDRIDAQLYWAHAFEEPVPQPDYNWQDDGIHYAIQFNF